MLKVEHSIDYLKKGRSSSETFEGAKHVKQVISQRKTLRFKRSDDNPELPENFKIGQAIGGGDCFFDSVAKGLKQLKPEMDFTVKSLREVCKRFAQSQLENDQSWLKGALRNEAEPISVYVPRIEFTADDIEQKSGSVNVLGLTSPIWGRSEIEGRIICKEYNVKLHVIEKHVMEGKDTVSPVNKKVWLDQIVNSEGSRSVDSIDYNDINIVHIINKGNAHFEPILSTQEIQHNKQQSSDYDDEVTPEEELINIIKSRDSEEEKLQKIRGLFAREPELNINFQEDKNEDTSLHIAVRKKELKVIEWLVKNGAKIDIKNSRGKTSLGIAKKHITPNGQDIVQILESHIQQVSVEEQPAKQERPSEKNKLEDSDRKNQRSEQERRIPYSNKLPFDKNLKLSNGNFKSIIESDIKHVELNTADKLNFLNRPAYPDEYLLVHFASRVYKEREDGQELPDRKLPEGWKLLTTAYNQGATNHYFGAAYWNPDQQQIVIAHRGTDPSSTGALWTDIRGILQNNYVPQMNSAVTFANKIKTVLDEFNKKPNINLQLSFTGHSLGGWLAQITTFTTKYFILESFDESSFFVKSEKVGHHAHTVTFDSPGSKDMLSKIKSDFDLRHYKDDNSLSLSYLDIASYLSAPNLVNTCCSHLGTIYRVFIENLPHERSSWDFAEYTKETHSIVKIEEALDPEKGNELKTVIDWPLVKKGITERALEKVLHPLKEPLKALRRVLFKQSGIEPLSEDNEYEYFHKLARDVSDYNPEPDDKEGYCTVRYQVQDVDKKKCSTRIFTQPELEFLCDYQKLRQFLTSPQLQGLFSSFNNENTVKKAIEALKNFKVEDRKKTVYCQSEKELDELITYVKNVLYFFPDIKSKTKNVQTRKPIWFDVEDLVRPFTALAPGRQEKLEQIASSIQEGIVVISGLGGVGKSELAVKYARSQYSQEDSVIWINAETRETAKDSFHRLHKKLGLKIKDEDGEEKSIELVIEEIYKHLNDGKRLFIFDNAEKYSTIEKFLPLGLPDNANKPYVLITSPNNLEWKSARVNIGTLSLGDFTDAEAIEFVKTTLEIGNDSQNVDITNLVKRLHNFPLALQHAVTYIKDASEEFQIRGSEFKISDYLEKYEQEPKKMLSIKSIDDEHTEAIFKVLKITIDKIRDNKEYGQQALDMLNIVSYFMSRNIPEKTFLNELASGNQEKLISITRLLRKYSIVNLEQNMLNVHGLVQQIRRIELENQQEEGKSLEEKTLERALGLLKEYVKVSPGNAASCIPHTISIWDYASKYDELIKSFIVDSTNNKATTSTTYFDLIIEGSNYKVINAIIKKMSSDNLKEAINAKNKNDVTPLHKAVLRNDEKIVKLLIDEGADVNAKKSNGWTPLHLAAKNGNLEIVNALLKKGANVDDKTSSKYQFTPLHLAARNGHKEVVEALKDANVNARTGYEFTPLHLAAGNGYLDVVQTLLKNDKINVDAKTEYKFTPLHLAAEKGHSKVVRALLDRNAGINALDNGNFTPLHLAALNGHLEVVNILLDKGANIDAKTIKGNTALHLAAEKGNLEIVEALIVRGTDVNIENEERKKALDLAAELKVKSYIIEHSGNNVISSQIEQSQKKTFNKREGTAGVGGQFYEIKLSELFLLQGITKKADKKINSFYLASNMEEADNLDDVVFKYEGQGGTGKSRIIFLQAKHKEKETLEDPEKKVTIKKLLSDSDADFSLQKYFASYLKIKQQFSQEKTDEPIFGNRFEDLDCDFIIYTNALPGFSTNKGGIEELEKSIRKVDVCKDSILNLSEEAPESSSYYELVFGKDKDEEIVNALQYSSDCSKLARELARSAFSKDGININKPIFQSYHVPLKEKVLEMKKPKEAKFKDSFLDDDRSLSEEDSKFRSVFLEEAKRAAKKSEDELKLELRNKSIKISDKFWSTGNIEQSKKKLLLPNDSIGENDIKEFLSKLKLFVGQPNESELGEIIKQKIQSTYKATEQDAELILLDAEEKIRKWWKGEDYYLTENDSFFENARQNLAKLELIAPALEYRDKVEKLGIVFNEDPIELKSFLTSNDKQIFNLVSPHETILGSVKTYQILPKDGGYIFIRLNSLLGQHIQNRVMQAFNLEATSYLLVIECESTGKDIEELYNRLSKIVRSTGDKKVILITQTGDPLADKFRHDFSEDGKYEEKIDEKNSLIGLTNESQNKLLSKGKVIFQGKEVSLGTLVDDKSKHLIDGEILSKLVNNEEIRIGKALTDLGEVEYYYIGRTLNRQIRQDFEKEGSQFLVTRSSQVQELEEDQDIVLISDTGESFKELCDKYEKYNIHWLRREDSKYVWQRSRGDLSKLHEFVCTNEQSIQEYKPEKITDITDRVVIISAEPGMGKSTVLTKLAQETKKSDPSLWVMRINLNDHTSKLKEVNLEEDLKDKAIEFLLDIGLETSQSQEKELFKHRINDQGKIALLFDGFDEISPTYKEKVIKLVKILEDTKVERLWVTTRPNMKSTLEGGLSTLSYTLKSLSTKDQGAFLKKFWSKKSGLDLNRDDSRVNNYIEGLLDILSNSIADKEVEFTGIPLQTRMLAEAFQDKFKEFYNSDQNNPNLPKKFDLVDLYQGFIDKKYNIYCEEKKKQNLANVAVEEDNADLRKSFIQNHQKAALYMLLEKGDLEDLFSNSESQEVSEFITRVKDGREKTGIIYQVINDNLSFIHRTFAEYFAACWLANNQEKQKVKNFLLSTMFKGGNEVLRNFFDRILTKDEHGENRYEIHNAVLNENEKKVQELLSGSQKTIDSLDKGGRTALHLAAAYGYDKIVQDLLSHGADIAKSDKVLNWSPLRYADKGNYWGIAELLLQKGANGDDMVETISSIKDVAGKKKETLLHLAAQTGHTKFAEVLVEKGADINAQNKDGKTPLHLAAENGHLGIVKLLVKEGAEININSSIGPPYRRRPSNWTPLHYAVFNSHIDVIKFLQEKGAKSIEDSNGSKPLDIAKREDIIELLGGEREHFMKAAIKNDDLENFKKLTEGTDFSKLSGWSILHDAASAGSLKIVDFLVHNGAKIDGDEGCTTPLAAAAAEGNLEVVKYLVKKGANINAPGTDGWTPFHAAARAARSHEDSKDLSESHYLEIIKYFVEGREKEDVNIDVADKKGTTPLQTAAHHNRFDIVKYLVEKGANINAIDKLGATIILSAAFNNNCEIVKFLIREGAMIDSDRGILGELHITVLHIAAMYNALEIVKFLVEEKKVDVNAGKDISLTPLHFAALSDNQGTIEYLIEHGADVNAVVKFPRIVKVLKEKKKALEGSSMYKVVGKVNNFFSKCLEIKGSSTVIGLTPNIVLKLSGHKSESLEEKSNKNIASTIRGFFAEKINSYFKEQFLMLKDFIEMRKVGNPEPLPQKFMLYLPDSIHQETHVDGEASHEECLSSTSHRRRKREAKGECLFTWEDVDEFNAEKDEKRDFSKINIDGEKFVDYVKDLPEEKRSQLIQLADKVQVTGRFQGLVNKLTSNQKVISHLNRVGKISGMTMHGMMAKNVLADFLNGDYQGVAINVGFIAGGQGFAKVAEAASIKGLELASEGKLLLGRSLRAASPFLARGTSAFVVYDLVNQVKAFKNGTEEALVGVIGDSIYLGVDSAEIGIEIAEAFEVFEGVSSVTGPIGAAIGAVVFVGTDIYMAVKRVDKIDQIIHLKGNERFIEGLRAFIGMEPEKYIEELMEEKQLYNQLVKQGLEYLKQHSDIQSYVFPTGKSVVDSCNKVQQSKRVCVSPGFNGCTRARTVTSYTEKCTTKFEEDLDNTVLLDRKRTDIKWSRAKPDNPSGGELFCLPRGNHERVPSYGSYLCENAIGLSAKTGNHTLINLGEGTDHAKGFIDSPNIFVVNNGSKKYHGGNKDDIFILQGSSITGYFYGEGGVNTLDLTSFAPEKESIDVKLHVGQVEDYYQDNSFGMSGINRFLGRKGKADRIFITCDSSTSDIKFVDGQGGSERFVDHIKIDDKDCAYEMQIVVRPNTVVYNRALKGDFHYIIPYALGSAKVDFIYTAEALNLNNTFAFEYEPAQIKNVDVRNINVLNKTSHIITFNFSPMSDKEFNITISGASNPSYRLGNNTEIEVGNKGNLYMLENTNKSVDEIIKDYLVVANRLNRMSFFIQSLLSNETVVIGSGNYEVINNNPLQKSHLVGNGGENVYVIDSKRFEIPLPEVVIYDLDVESSVDTIDLRNLVQQTRGEFSNSFKLQILKSANDLLLKATVEKPPGDSSISEKHEYFTVRLKDGVNWYNRTHVIMDNVPMKINLDNNEWSLKPLPLKFEKDKEVIVVTSQDIKENTELVTPKRAGNYTFVRDNGSDLIVTNAFDSSITKNDLCSITLSKFYEEPKMGTLSIKFADKEVVLKEHQGEISSARDVNVVKKEYKDQVYNDVFNHTKSSPEVMMLSDQPMAHKHRHSRHRQQTRHRRSENITSNGTRPSSWINDLFGWVKSSIGGLLSSALSKETSSTPSSISQVHASVDVNGTIMLLDVLIRKVTGQKYISTADQHVSLLEAQGYALNITEEFEKVVEQAALKSGISMHRLDIDFVEIQKEVTEKIMSGKFNEISEILSSYVEKACTGREAGYPGKLSSKKFDKFMLEFNSRLNVVLDQSIQQILHNVDGTLEVDGAKKRQMSLEPQSYLSNASVHSHSEVSTCLSEIGVTKLGGNLNR